MPYFRLGKEREALAQRGESYRLVAMRFLESKGWHTEAESSIEGTFEDIVMARAGTQRMCVECKATKVSLHSRRFLAPFCLFLSRFVRLPRESRFRSCFVLREVTNAREFEDVFQDFLPEALASLRARCTGVVRKLETKRPRLNLVDPSEIEDDLFVEFVHSVDVYEGDVRDLEDATRLRDSRAAARSSVLMTSTRSGGAEALRRAALADEVEETIVTELLPITELPKLIVAVPDRSPKRGGQGARKQLRRIKIDGIAKGGLRYFLGGLPASGERLTSLDPIQEAPEDWVRHPDKQIWLQQLLNQAIGAYCCSKGMYQGTNVHRYAFVPDSDDGLTILWYPGGRKIKRDVVQKRLGVAGKMMFAHRAVDLRAVFLDDEPYLQIETNWEFTEDGRRFLPAKVGEALRKAYRKRERNRSRLVDLVFWLKYLAGRSERIIVPVGGEGIQIDANLLEYQVDRGLQQDQMDLASLLSTPVVPFVEEFAMEPAEDDESPLEPWLDPGRRG